MQIGENREVRYDIFCRFCKHNEKDSIEEPCNDCLNSPTVPNSRMPYKFEGDKKSAIEELKEYDRKRREES